MKKTVIQKLIEYLKTESAYYTKHDHIQDRMYKMGLENAISMAIELLEEEKQIVMDAYDEGFGKFNSSEQYFEETYGK